jgi:proline iminopeptidase
MLNFENGEHYIVVNRIKHWCRIAGNRNNGIPLVILHGGPGGNHYVFERTLGAVLENFSTIIYYEQRGCGRSEHPEDPEAYSIELLISDLHSLLDRLGLEKVSLLGYSFGGELAMEYTIAHPERVEKLFLQAPSINDTERLGYIQTFGFSQIAVGEIKQKITAVLELQEQVDQRLNKIWGMVDAKTVDCLLFHNEEYAILNRSLWGESKLKNTGLMFAAIQKQKRDPLLERVGQIQQKTLFLVGLHDRNTGVELSRDLMSKMPNAQIEIFFNSAHFPDIEETEKYAEVVRKFLGY